MSKPSSPATVATIQLTADAPGLCPQRTHRAIRRKGIDVAQVIEEHRGGGRPAGLATYTAPVATQAGKRFRCGICEGEIVVTKGGDGEVSCCSQVMVPK